jgi:O-acetylserine/cysteine efflux transporter
MRKKDVFLAILVAFIWGSNFTAVKLSLIEIPGFLAIALRFIVTAIILFPFVSKPKNNFREIYFASITFGVFYLGLLYCGMAMGLSTSLSIIITQLYVPISLIIAHIVFKEAFSFRISIGVLVAFCGMFVVVGTPQITGNFAAAVMMLFAAFFCAIYNIQSKKLKAIPALSLVYYANIISAPHVLLISYLVEGNPFELLQGTSYMLWVSLAYSALVAGIAGVGFWIYLLQKYPVYQVAPFNLLIPFFGIGVSIFILGEIPSWHVFLGGVVTLLGIAITNVKRL